jgi:hypothetical protein
MQMQERATVGQGKRIDHAQWGMLHTGSQTGKSANPVIEKMQLELTIYLPGWRKSLCVQTISSKEYR